MTCPEGTLRVAVLGETSGRVRDAFRRRGHDAIRYGALMADRMRERGVVIDVSGWDSHRGAKA